MTTVLIISIIIIVVVIAATALTTSKAYSYKHTIDEIQQPDFEQDSQDNKNRGE